MKLFLTTSLFLATITGASHAVSGVAGSLAPSPDSIAAELNLDTSIPQRKTYTVFVSGKVGADKWSFKDLPHTIKDIKFRSSTVQYWSRIEMDGRGTNTLAIKVNKLGVVGTAYSGYVTVDVIY